MVNARPAKIAQHIGTGLSVALAYKIATEFSGVSQSLLGTVTIQAPMVPFTLRRSN